MTIRKIAQMGEPILRRRAEEVPTSEIAGSTVQTLIDDMIETMRDADGAGIAAPQVYAGSRICVIEVDTNPRYSDFPAIPLITLINPIVTPIDDDTGSIEMYEGCLSVTGIRGRVRRPRHVRVTALDRDGRPVELDWQGVPAAIVQHETDHLDGVLFVDRADPKSLTFLREYDRYVSTEDRIADGD